MADSINSLIGAGDDKWNTSEQDAKRQAIASLRGYAYQLHQSLAAWIALPDEATLHLEISEDYAQIARDPLSLETVLTATQIKDTRESGSVTLNSADVKAAIRNYWALREANPGRPVRMAFLTTSPIGQERTDPLPEGAGLEVWHTAARTGPLAPLRAALIQRFGGAEDVKSGLAAFLRSSDDDTLRKNLITPIHWTAGAPSIATIAADNRSALITLGHQFGGLPDLSARAADTLLAAILDAIVGGGDRRLRRSDLLFTIHEAVTVRVPAQQALMAPSLMPRGLDLEATGAWRVIATPLPRSAPREAAIRRLRTALSPAGVAWLHGATGLGKTILAEFTARSIGGRWRVIDLRGTTGAIARERLVAARLAILADPDVAGLVIDDLAPTHETDIETCLTELAASLQQRHLPLIVTSNHPPGQRQKRALAMPDTAVHAAPSFESGDAAALVAAYGGDPAKWAWFVLLVGGGHPQLVDVAIAGLAEHGWPDDAMQKWASSGMKNPSVEAEREAARRRLLAELAPEVLALLARTVRIYGTFDRALGVAVGTAAPVLNAPGLALDQLTGHWIERAYVGRMRASPLVTGLDAEMLDAAALKALDLTIVKHIFSRKSVDADLFDTAFYHAWLAGDTSWINVLVQLVLQANDEERPKLASLMPMFRGAKADPAFLNAWPLPKLLLRLAQHLLKSAIGTDAEIAASAQSLIESLDATEVGDPEFQQSTAGIVLMKLLFDAYGFGRIPGWFDHLQRFARIVQEDPTFRNVSDRVAMSADADPTGHLFIGHAAHLPGVGALASLFDGLDSLPQSQRQTWIDAMNDPPNALGMVIDNAWLKETRLDTFDAQATAGTFERLGTMAIDWKADQLAGRCLRTQALILDEYVKDREAAEAALDIAAARLPNNYDIERERGKIAWRADDYAKAYRILIGLEDRYANVDGIDAAFALREAAISAAHTDKPLEAARLFDKARGFVLESRDGVLSPLSVGLAADAAAMRFGAGEEAQAAREMAAVLDELAMIDPRERPTAHSVHLLVRHLVLWMKNKHDAVLVDGQAPIYLPGAASNPDPKPRLAEFPVTPLDPAWMLIAGVALRAGVPFQEVIGWPGLVAARGDAALDTIVRHDLLDHAIESGDLENFSRFLIPAIEGFVHTHTRRDEGRNYDPFTIRMSSIPVLSPHAMRHENARGYLRDAALAQSLVALSMPKPNPGSLFATRNALLAAAGYDVMPEWGAGADLAPKDYRQTVARAMLTVTSKVPVEIKDLFIAHLRMLEWTQRTIHHRVAIPALARRVRQDWSAVLAERRALLLMPMINAPAIEAALTGDRDDAALVAAVLLAAAPAVSVSLGEDMRALLESLRNGV